VSEKLPSVTVLIAARPGQAEVKAALAARALDWPHEQLEILIARGTQPSVQRNTGMRQARGDLIYFLDDDSVPEQASLRRAVSRFGDDKVVIVGGPNICPPNAPWLEQVFALALGSLLAFGPSRARYARVGSAREGSEKELILCNLLARRAPLLELGGFNEALYPNEENALMDQLQQLGFKLVYDTDFVVLRRPRSSLRAFCRMLLTYGRGRAEQFRVHPTFGSVLNFVPPLFCLYLISLPLVLPLLGGLGALPLALYCIAVVSETMVLANRGGLTRGLAAMPLLVLVHVLYGIGFFHGLVTTLKPAGKGREVQVSIESVPLLPGPKRVPEEQARPS